MRLLQLTPEGVLFRTVLFEALCDRAKAIGARFIGLDPAIKFTEGDEADNKHQRELGDMADALAIQTGACVLVNTHAAKRQRNEDLQSHSSRGAGSLTDAVRAELVLQGMTDTEATARGIAEVSERKRYVKLALVKANHAPPEAFEPLWLKRTENGVLVEVGPEEMPQPQEKGRVGASQRDLAAFELLWRAGSGDHVPIAKWRECCVSDRIISATTDQGQANEMKKIAKRLMDGGLIFRNAAGKATTYMPRQSAERFTDESASQSASQSA